MTSVISKESAGKKKGSGSAGHGNRYLARVLGEAAVGASKTPTFLGERYRRIARRRGKQRAVVAVGRSILTIVWQLLSHPDAHFSRHDGVDRRGAAAAARRAGPALAVLGVAVAASLAETALTLALVSSG
ncbi:hypothetical protein [Streptosporangium sp. OZ121]|uniref:hypothetical protein n=1 Tax=Streptosporangium sp. OZ121 TaxID=3444183 RepID=UPI003F7A4A73